MLYSFRYSINTVYAVHIGFTLQNRRSETNIELVSSSENKAQCEIFHLLTNHSYTVNSHTIHMDYRAVYTYVSLVHEITSHEVYVAVVDRTHDVGRQLLHPSDL